MVKFFLVVIGMAALDIIFLSLMKKKPKVILASLIFLVYLCCVYAGTVFLREDQGYYWYKTELFWSYKMGIVYPGTEMFRENVLNIGMFIPLGFLGCLAFHGKPILILFTGGFVSLSIEALQLYMRRGLCEIDDLIHNTTGCLIGIVLYYICKMLFLIIRWGFCKSVPTESDKSEY